MKTFILAASAVVFASSASASTIYDSPAYGLAAGIYGGASAAAESSAMQRALAAAKKVYTRAAQTSQSAAAEQWTGMGGPEEEMQSGMTLAPKDPSLPRMAMSSGAPAQSTDKPGGIVMQHPTTANYTGVGGPDESAKPRFYPRCRSRSDDRCQQGS